MMLQQPPHRVLPTRRLGNLVVPAIGFGAMGLSPGMYGAIDDQRAIRALRHAIDAGATFLDTADAYGVDGHNERLVGRAIRGRRDEVLVATKFGLGVPDGVTTRRIPVGYAFGELTVNAKPGRVREYATRSLRNLGTDVIDLYYLHFPDPAVPIEDTVGAVADLVAAGLVRHLGLSNVDAEQVRRAHAVHPVTAVQTEWSMWRPAPADLVAAAAAVGAGLVAWGPLGGGFLTGTVDGLADEDFRHHNPRYSPENLATNNDRYAPLRSIAADLAISPSQLALAWLLHQNPHVVPIPGSRTPEHIDENLAAAGLSLHADTLARIDAGLAAFQPVGATLL